MYRLLEFLRKVYVFLLFIVLECGAFYVYVSADSYARAKMLSIQSSVVGSVDYFVRGAVDYLSLKGANRELLSRVAELEQRLARVELQRQDSLMVASSYYDELAGVSYQAAYVVSNTINRKHNYMVINQGVEHGVRTGMGVVTPEHEMVGVVLECTDRYSVVMSTLNTRFRTSGEVEGDGYAGYVFWEGSDRYRMRMKDLSKYADVQIGSRVVTTSFSQIFPAGVTIGHIVDIEYDQQTLSYDLKIELAADISRVDRVLVVNYNVNAGAEELIHRVDNDFKGADIYPELRDY